MSSRWSDERRHAGVPTSCCEAAILMQALEVIDMRGFGRWFGLWGVTAAGVPTSCDAAILDARPRVIGKLDYGSDFGNVCLLACCDMLIMSENFLLPD
ncbi:hypothetical protein HBH69_059870 [Parastagonospora nodorum]|nr:hypothetical protein HBH49_088910 [Parastagonospora nodorum]KAH4906083.1 hypothetical protein HBH74_178550 [Parastagonospora nodorum]KAH4929299.1 hypothetical protein HBH73_196730 [Parastagonospora nodorum]KAH4976440.1 hypothetical protein HBI76_238890 [Parastagonospora nodorum]KAH5159513.1 hypothetical protein HBH69_059870 [Parastagonospora nodorum]